MLLTANLCSLNHDKLEDLDDVHFSHVRYFDFHITATHNDVVGYAFLVCVKYKICNATEYVIHYSLIILHN